MTISIQQLLASKGSHNVVIHSLERSLYQVTVFIEDKERLLRDNNGKPFRRRSLNAVKESLQGAPISQLSLRQQSAYDEMIGQPLREADNALMVPLSLDIYPPVPVR
jgi:hypothetical protein